MKSEKVITQEENDKVKEEIKVDFPIARKKKKRKLVIIS